MAVERVTDAVAYHGEGPVWSERWGGLRWVDMLAGDVLTLAPDGTVGRSHVASVVAAIRPRAGGGAVLGVERGFALEDSAGTITRLGEVWSDPGVRMNEGGCDPDGRFYCGSMSYEKEPGAGALYRLDPEGRVTTVLEDVTISNGIEWSVDGTSAYYNDTGTQRTDVFDYGSATGLTERRPFVVFRDGERPDGLTVDAEGGVWIAVVNRGEVRRYTGGGTPDEVVKLPATKVTACAFGGTNLDELFITTSREGLVPGEEPAAGSLFRWRPGVRGLPVREFGGVTGVGSRVAPGS